jgi:hypothetical protein
MDKIDKEAFEAWIKENNWFKVGEGGNANGQQRNYLTPAGEFVFVQYNLEGEVLGISKPMPMPVQSKVSGHFPIDFRGGGKLPGMPPG